MARFECEIPKRWSDLDSQGHVNNTLFVDYLQEARVNFLHASPNNHMLGKGVLVVRHEVEYLHQIEYSTKPVRAVMAIEEVGGARFVLAYELYDGEHLAARARTVLAPFDITTGKVRRLTDAERTAFRADAEKFVELRDVPRPRWDDEGYRFPMRVRWSDLDAYGHVNNATFYDYMQEARTGLLMSISDASFGKAKQVMWMVVRQDVDYVTQLSFRHEPYDCLTVVAKVGTTSMTLACEMRDENNTVYAACRTVLVCTDMTGRPIPLPENVRAGLESRVLAQAE